MKVDMPLNKEIDVVQLQDQCPEEGRPAAWATASHPYNLAQPCIKIHSLKRQTAAIRNEGVNFKGCHIQGGAKFTSHLI